MAAVPPMNLDLAMSLATTRVSSQAATVGTGAKTGGIMIGASPTMPTWAWWALGALGLVAAVGVFMSMKRRS